MFVLNVSGERLGGGRGVGTDGDCGERLAGRGVGEGDVAGEGVGVGSVAVVIDGRGDSDGLSGLRRGRRKADTSCWYYPWRQ